MVAKANHIPEIATPGGKAGEDSADQHIQRPAYITLKEELSL